MKRWLRKFWRAVTKPGTLERGIGGADHVGRGPTEEDLRIHQEVLREIERERRR